MRALIFVLCGATFSFHALCAESTHPSDPSSVRIKDVAEILGVRENQLVGEGLLVGLEGTGDKTGDLTNQALANFIARMGINVSVATLKPKNVAIVAVTAQLPPFIKKGSKIDVQISSIGDASSLQGGILLQTPLQGADGRVYAVAQGSISIGGFSVSGGGGGGEASVQKNHTLAGRIPNGALIEREVDTSFVHDGIVKIVLRKPDFTTAQRMSNSINDRWAGSSRAIDPHMVEFVMPVENESSTALPMVILSELETLRFVPDVRARVVVNERTGTIVAGSNVRLLPTVLSHGNLYIRIQQVTTPGTPAFVGPPGKNITNVVVGADEEKVKIIPFEFMEKGATILDLANALNALHMRPRDIIAIFQALKEAGALNAELVIM